MVCQAHLTVGGYLGLRLVEFLYPSDTDDVIAHRKSCQTKRISWFMGMGFFFVFPLAKRGTTGPFQRVHTSQMANTNLT